MGYDNIFETVVNILEANQLEFLILGDEIIEVYENFDSVLLKELGEEISVTRLLKDVTRITILEN